MDDEGPLDIDVNVQRDPAITLYGLPVTDEARTFYYDETNNHRLVKVTPDGLNVADPRPFILGGVSHPGPRRDIDLMPLRRTMGIQPGLPELKYDKVAKGDFPRMLGSQRLAHFLSWIVGEDLLIHFIAVDPVYYSFVDIIDSMPQVGMFDFEERMILKNDLYRVLRDDPALSQHILRQFSYPAVAGGDVRGFLTALIDILEDGPDLMPHFNRTMLRGVLQSGRHLSSLPLLDDAPHVLMAGFDAMFTHRICLFKASQHIFDDEDVVSKVLSGYRFVDVGRPLDLYRFVDSKAESGVQVADVMVGLLGACLSWLRHLNEEDILESMASFSAMQEQNRRFLAELIDRSVAQTSAFVQNVISLDDIRRFWLFLRD